MNLIFIFIVLLHEFHMIVCVDTNILYIRNIPYIDYSIHRSYFGIVISQVYFRPSFIDFLKEMYCVKGAGA